MSLAISNRMCSRDVFQAILHEYTGADELSILGGRETTSLASSIYKGVVDNGRRYAISRSRLVNDLVVSCANWIPEILQESIRCALKAKFSIHVPGTDDHDLHRTRQEGTRDEVRLHCR